MSEYEPKLWRCEQCGIVLGIVKRESDRRPKLNVLRLPTWVCTMDLVVTKICAREVFAIVDMEQGTVRCPHCGAERTWRMGDQALEDLLANRKKRTFGLEVEHA